MKTRTNLISKKSLIKATSGIMSLVLTANIGLSLLDKNVFAGEVSITNGVVTLTSSFGDTDSEFHLANGGISYSRDNQDFNEPVSDNASFTIKNSTLYVDSDYSFNSITLNNSTLYINGCSVEWVSISGSGTAKITNCGTIDTDGFSASILANNGIRYFQNGVGTKPGTIIGRSVSINNNIYSDVSGSVIEAQNAFRKDTRDINATVDVGSLTTIESEGGTFTLSVYGATKVISGEVADGTDAYTLFDSPEVALSGIPSVIYYGQEYNISDYVSFAEGYDESLITYEYSSNGGLNVMEGKPSYPGNYSVRAKAPSYGSFLEKNTGWTSYTIQFLSMDELDKYYGEDEPYVTVTGVENERYVADGITLSVPDGVQIKFPTSSRDDLLKPAQTVTLTHDDLFLEGYTTINQDFEIEFVKADSGATTRAKSIVDVVDGIEDFIFDTDTPSISVREYNGSDYSETIDITKDSAFVTEKMSFVVYDDNLATVTTDINGTITSRRVSEGVCNFVLSSVADEPQVIKITATDWVGRETVKTITLYRTQVTPSLTVTLPEIIYVGDEYEPVIETESDGEISVVYYYTDGRNTVLLTPPTSAGTYQIHVTVAETDVYDSASYTDTFDIVKHPMTPTVTVEDTYVGESYEPSLSSVPEDYEGSITFEFKLASDPDAPYSDEFPEAAGTYTVKATLEATSYYNEATCTSNFTIWKQEYLGSISASNIYVGDPINVRIYNTSEDRDDLIFEYKLVSELDSAFTTVEPQSAGTYRVRVTAPENYYYDESIFTADFTISKRPITATVSVDDLKAGDEIVPVITTDPEGYVGEITYEYKLSTDTEYSSSVPTTAGTYTVKATLSATDVYEGTYCTDTFTISRNEVEATVSVADFYVGGTIAPIVTTESNGKELATFEYKLKSDEDDGYSSTVPTAAGEYTVRVTIPETDKYSEIVCFDDFKILKNEVTATVSVANITVGNTPAPVVTTVSNGKELATFEYKLKSDEDDGYSSTVPTAAGEYTVRATIPETAMYNEVICTADFTISKNSCTVVVTAEDTYVNVEPYIEITTVSNGKESAIIEYKKDGDPDTAYTDEIPSAAGRYILKVTIPETGNYLSCSDTCDFYVNQTPATSVSVEDIYFGETPDPKITVNSVHTPVSQTIEYKLVSEPDSAYSETVPTAIGEYKVRVQVEFPRYLIESTCYTTFNIKKLPVVATVTVPNTVVNGSVEPEINVETINYNGDIDDAVIEYKLTTNSDTAYTQEKPSAAGNYSVRVTLPSTDIYEGTVCENTFTINKHVPRASIEASNIYVGDSPDITLTGNIMTRTDLIYEYKSVSASGSSYSLDEPATAGNYNVRVTAPETDYYEEAVFTSTFTVSKRPCAVNVTAYEIYAGDEPNLEISTNSDGIDQATYEYKEYSEQDSAYKAGYPTEAGYYVIKVTIPETTKFLSGSGTCEMQVNRNTVIATISVADIFVGETPAPVITSDSPAKNNATIEYKLASENDSAYSENVPTDAGTYSVRASLPFTAFYAATTCETTFEIKRNPVTATVSVEDIYIGGTITPVVTTASTGAITYEYMDVEAATAEYSTAVPTAAGKYSIRATVAQTAIYESTYCTSEFEIKKLTVSATLSVVDITVGETVNPVVVTTPSDYNGTITYYHKVSNGLDSEYVEGLPTLYGSYTVKAILSETDKYLSTFCTDEFTISKKGVTATVSVEDIIVGGTINPVVTIIEPQDFEFFDEIIYQYKLTSEPDSAYSQTVPTAAGEYTIKVLIPPTDILIGGTCTDTFTISKKNATASVSVSNIYVGGTVSPVVTTESDGKKDAIIEYKLTTAPESSFSTTAPTAAGTYVVRVTVPETPTYTSAIASNSFTISKKTATATVSVENIFVGGTVSPVVTTVSDGKNAATFEYKAADADVSEYSETIPTAAGTYSIRANIPATAEYLSITCSSEFTISLNKVSVMNLTVEDVYYGQTVTPVFKTDSAGSVTIMYKLTVAPDSAYSATVPTATGDYTARAVVSETAVYESAVCYTEFSISYLEAPQVAYNPTGTSGKEGYFTSDVQLAAPEGYTISATSDGEYSNSIPYTEELDKIYLRRDDGALTSAITIIEKPRIDKSAPSITASAGPIATGSVIYVSDMNVTISDPNLKSLTLNGEPIDLKQGTSNVITLSPGYGIKTFVITAEDIAGNVTTIEFTLKAEWLEDKIILPDVVLPLFSEESYNLDDGQWIVTKNTTSGAVKDTTVYNSDLPVYVNEDGDYTFTKVI